MKIRELMQKLGTVDGDTEVILKDEDGDPYDIVDVRTYQEHPSLAFIIATACEEIESNAST